MRYSNLRLVDASLLNEYCEARRLAMDGEGFEDAYVLFHSWMTGFLDVSEEKAQLIWDLQSLDPSQWNDDHRSIAQELDGLPWAEEGESASLDDLAQRARNDFIALQNRFEMLELLKLVDERKPKVVVEIGTAAGGMFYCFAQLAHPEATLISIDLPGGPFGGGNSERESQLFRSFLGPCQTGHFIRDRSFHYSSLREVEAILDGRKIDLLFIDGDHSYGGVVADFTMYGPLVAPGGLIAMHDIILEPSVWGRGADAGEAWKFLRQSKRSEEIFDPNGRRKPPEGGRPKDYDDMARIAWGIGLIHV